MTRPAMAIHGGAGALSARDYSREVEHMRSLAEAGREWLAAGAAASAGTRQKQFETSSKGFG